MTYYYKRLVFIVTICFSCTITNAQVTIIPKEYDGPVRNPYKGFEIRPPLPLSQNTDNDEWYKLGSVVNVRGKTRWFKLEENNSWGKQEMAAYVEKLLDGFDEYNCQARFRPGPTIGMNAYKSALPDDLPIEDYQNQTPYFHERLTKLIKNLGAVIDGDYRIAEVEIGLIGKWGEQHSPSPAPQTQEVIGEAYSTYFTKTLVYNRNHTQFLNFDFGLFNDAAFENSGGCGGWMEMEVTEKFPNRWKTYPMEGEIRYSYTGSIFGKGRESFPSILQEDKKTIWAINAIRSSHYLHCAMYWREWYNAYHSPSIEELSTHERQNMFAIHKAIGYRFMIKEFCYPAEVKSNDYFKVTFQIVNAGASAVSYNWPLELSFLDMKTKIPIWKIKFRGVDIRKWIGGEGYPVVPDRGHLNYMDSVYAYTKPAPVYTIENMVQLPDSIPSGEYIIAISILNPKGRPAMRFAVQNYFNGGRHPMGYIGVNQKSIDTEINETLFDDIYDDPLCRPDNLEIEKTTQ